MVPTQNFHHEHEDIWVKALYSLQKTYHNSGCMKLHAILLKPYLTNINTIPQDKKNSHSAEP
jgi:hypothetical protein